MKTDLSLHIERLRVVDTHEHQMSEAEWVQRGPGDVLADLFWDYAQRDLISAGSGAGAVSRVLDGADTDIEGRFGAIEPAWRAMQFTGYGEAVRLTAKHVYGIDEITPASLRAAGPVLTALRKPGERYRFLREVMNLDHVQINHFGPPPTPDASGADFFLYDLGWAMPCTGYFEAEHFGGLGISITDIPSLSRLITAYFNRHAPLAIAVKTQHAYQRTLHWEKRSDADAGRALAAVLKDPQNADTASRLCLGDWCLAAGVEQAIRHNLPVKIHTGYYYNNNLMPMDRIRPSLLCPLLMEYPAAKFVLMHMGYPYGHEIPALAKHFSNVYVDLCWAWAMDPLATMEVVRHHIHAAPINKLFAFGGDAQSPTAAYGFLLQMRRWLGKTLEAEIASGTLTEKEAMDVATRVLRENQLACFDVAGRQARLRAGETPSRHLATV